MRIQAKLMNRLEYKQVSTSLRQLRKKSKLSNRSQKQKIGWMICRRESVETKYQKIKCLEQCFLILWGIAGI